MPTKRNRFELEVSANRARKAVHDALAELDWECLEDGVIVAHENPARLCCVISPVTARIACEEATAGSTRLEIEVSVPGFGPVPKSQLADRSAGLEQRIRRWAAKPATEPSGPARVAR